MGTDAELLKRLRASYSELEVAVVEKRLAEIRLAIAEGRAEESLAAEIHKRFTYQMQDLGEYLKTLLGRFTRWFNGSHERTGTLWEGRFKSVLVEEGMAARAMAASIMDEIFNSYRERFGARRKDGARAPRGRAAPAKGVLWSEPPNFRQHRGHPSEKSSKMLKCGDRPQIPTPNPGDGDCD